MRAKNHESITKVKIIGMINTGMNYRNIILEKFLRIIFQSKNEECYVI